MYLEFYEFVKHFLTHSASHVYTKVFLAVTRTAYQTPLTEVILYIDCIKSDLILLYYIQ